MEVRAKLQLSCVADAVQLAGGGYGGDTGGGIDVGCLSHWPVQ